MSRLNWTPDSSPASSRCEALPRGGRSQAVPAAMNGRGDMLIVILVAAASLVVRAVADVPAEAAAVEQHDAEDSAPLDLTGRPAAGRAPRRPCVCADGQCGCCSGFVAQNLVNLTPRQRGCLNITYDPDDFAFAMALSFNDRVLYKNAISAKNPRPLCVSVPVVAGAKMCVKLSNVYFVGRNLHACIDMEAKWQDTQTFQMTFDCIRIGADGVKVVKPEDGAGLAVGVPVGASPAPDEYDEIPAEQPAEQPAANQTSAAATGSQTSTTASSNDV